MKVILSPLAKLKLNLLLQYLEEEWDVQSRKKFLSKLKSSVNSISLFPESNPKSEKYNGLYKKVVTNQTSLYYRILDDEIQIITVIDNRQDPENIFKEINKFFDL